MLELVSPMYFFERVFNHKKQMGRKRLLYVLLTGVDSIHFYRSWRFSLPSMADIFSIIAEARLTEILPTFQEVGTIPPR